MKNVVRFKRQTLISLFGLITGLSCVFVIAAWAFQEMRYDRFHHQSETLYMVTTEIKGNNDDVNVFPETPPPLAKELLERIPALENSFHFIYLYGGRSLRYKDYSFEEAGIASGPSLLTVFNFPLLQGSALSLDEPNSIIITQRIADKLFPGENPLEKPIIYNSDKTLIVKGILKNLPENSSLKFDFVVSYELESGDPNQWWQLSDATFIKLFTGSDLEDVRNMAEMIWREKISDDQYGIDFVPVTWLRYRAPFDFFNAEHGNAQKLYAFMGIAVLILILASLNYINLVSAYSIKRSKEVGIRKVYGAESKTIRNQFLTESVVISIIAGGMAIFISVLLVHYFKQHLGLNISSKYLLISFSAGIPASVIIVGYLSGLGPAILASSNMLFHTRHNRTFSFRHQRKFRDAFILGQFILSISLIIASLVILNQIRFMNDFDVGYHRENIVQVNLPAGYEAHHEKIRSDLMAHPVIENVSFSGSSPVNLSPLHTTEGWTWDGLMEGSSTSIYRLYIDHHFLGVFDIPLLRGNNFSSSESDENKVLINETMAGLSGMGDPIGKTLRRGDKSYEIIGIVGDFNFQHLSNKVQPLVLLYNGKKNKMFVRTGNSIGRALDLLNEHISQINDQGLTFSFISDEYMGLYRSERRISYAIIVFTMLTVLLSSIGLIGLVTYNIEMRTREIGIRKVCGASVKEVILLLSRVLIKWYLIGSLISCGLSWIVMKAWLDNFAYRISLSWLFFMSGSLIILGVTILTVGMQTWKASIANPVDILKYE